MTDSRIINALKEAGIDFNQTDYDPSKSFFENGIDSLDVMSLFLFIEENYSVKFSEAEVDQIQNPDDLAKALDKHLA